MLILLFGFCLLAGPWFESGWMEYRFVPVSASVRITAFGLTWCGIVFSIWARLTLGGNWSGRPSLMAGHELITSGPYAIARHPIYTGLILAAAGTSLAVGELHSLLGFLLLILMFFFKIRAEEQIMLKAFPDAYPRYRSRVKALIPGML